MNRIIKINPNNMQDYASKIELAKTNFIPMLPFVPMPFHDFDKYKTYNDKGIYLIDKFEDSYCLYHLYHLTPGDDTLRATLILPSSWDKRFEIIQKSIQHIKDWFLKEDNSKRFIIQSLEYGEIEYYPTLSHYLIPTIIGNGFKPIYRMYLKRPLELTPSDEYTLSDDFTIHTYTKEMKENVIQFYYEKEESNNKEYFVNCTKEELLELLEDEFIIKYSKFIKCKTGEIIAGIIPSKDSDKLWIDNLTIDPSYDHLNISEFLLQETIKDLRTTLSSELIYIYLNRDCTNARLSCERNGFVPIEHWVDMILEK
jgi:hypothetical protein